MEVGSCVFFWPCGEFRSCRANAWQLTKMAMTMQRQANLHGQSYMQREPHARRFKKTWPWAPNSLGAWPRPQAAVQPEGVAEAAVHPEGASEGPSLLRGATRGALLKEAASSKPLRTDLFASTHHSAAPPHQSAPPEQSCRLCAAVHRRRKPSAKCSKLGGDTRSAFLSLHRVSGMRSTAHRGYPRLGCLVVERRNPPPYRHQDLHHLRHHYRHHNGAVQERSQP